MAAPTRSSDVLRAIEENEYPSGSDDHRFSNDDSESIDALDIEQVNGSDNSASDVEVPEDADSDNDASLSEDETHTRPKRSYPEREWHWIKKDLPEIQTEPENILIPNGPALAAETSLDMFFAHFDHDIIDHLTLETNRQRILTDRTRVKVISSKEVRQFMGICLYMSVVSLPQRRMFWSANTRQEMVAKTMSLNRFEEILSLLHASDNSVQVNRGEEGYDRLFKVRYLLTKLNENFQQNAENELLSAVDEQIVPFKGRHGLKVYMKSKPKKWGYKIWALAGQTGYVHKFFFYGDNTLSDFPVPDRVGESGKIVLQLTEDLPRGSFVFFDNYFGSPALLKELKSKGINGTCTLRQNRTAHCPLACQKDLKKKGRGGMDFRQDRESEVLVCEWFDNRTVIAASTAFGINPVTKVQRYDRKKKQSVSIECPSIITHYNKCMGGVDTCDMMMSLYRNTRKTTKWYKRIIFHLIDLCVVNSWILHRQSRPEDCKPLVDFRLDVAMGLMSVDLGGEREEPAPREKPSPTVRVKDVAPGVRYDNVGHLPLMADAVCAPRCKFEGCPRRSRMYCVKCHVFLCCDRTSACFFDFHSR